MTKHEEIQEPDLVIQPEPSHQPPVIPLNPPEIESPPIKEPTGQSIDIAWEVLDVLTS